jgi:hypothetical protein
MTMSSFDLSWAIPATWRAERGPCPWPNNGVTPSRGDLTLADVCTLLSRSLPRSSRDWLTWARRSGIHPWVIDYISQRPDHLASAPPRHEEPFSTPRAWHILSDLLHSYGAGPVLADGKEIGDDLLRILTLGTVSPSHAGQFRGYGEGRRVPRARDHGRGDQPARITRVLALPGG